MRPCCHCHSAGLSPNHRSRCRSIMPSVFYSMSPNFAVGAADVVIHMAYIIFHCDLPAGRPSSILSSGSGRIKLRINVVSLHVQSYLQMVLPREGVFVSGEQTWLNEQNGMQAGGTWVLYTSPPLPFVHFAVNIFSIFSISLFSFSLFSCSLFIFKFQVSSFLHILILGARVSCMYPCASAFALWPWLCRIWIADRCNIVCNRFSCYRLVLPSVIFLKVGYVM